MCTGVPSYGLEEVWAPPEIQVQTWAPSSNCRESMGLMWEPLVKSWFLWALGAITGAWSSGI